MSDIPSSSSPISTVTSTPFLPSQLGVRPGCEGSASHLTNAVSSTIPPPPPLPPAPTRKPLNKQNVKQVHMVLYEEPPRAKVPPSTPCHIFLYGTLMDPEVLQSILDLPFLPSVIPSAIYGFSVRMWGIYPALVPATDKDSGRSRVDGVLWKVQSNEQCRRLSEYDTGVYTWCECDVQLLGDGGNDGHGHGDAYGKGERVLRGCKTFCWARNPQSSELEEGMFNFERWKKYFKGSVVRRPATIQ